MIQLAEGLYVCPVCGAFNGLRALVHGCSKCEEKRMSEEKQKQESAVVAFVIAQANDEQLLSMTNQLLGAVLRSTHIKDDERIAIRTANGIVTSVLEARNG